MANNLNIIRDLSSINTEEAVVSEILALNEKTAEHGLILNEAEATEVAEARISALHDTGRLDFRGGTVSGIIEAFCDSPYINSSNYKDTICELLYLFYEYKNLFRINDSELIKYMAELFNSECHGSLELLNSTCLSKLSRDNRR